MRAVDGARWRNRRDPANSVAATAPRWIRRAVATALQHFDVALRATPRAAVLEPAMRRRAAREGHRPSPSCPGREHGQGDERMVNVCIDTGGCRRGELHRAAWRMKNRAAGPGRRTWLGGDLADATASGSRRSAAEGEGALDERGAAPDAAAVDEWTWRAANGCVTGYHC